MSEIGSEFWNIPLIDTVNNIFPKDTQWFLSGRSALISILKDIQGAHTVAMPSWCCDSMIAPFVNAGYEVYFYPVYWDHQLIQDIDDCCDVLFMIDYFGYSSGITTSHKCVIRDVTHSLFSHKYDDAKYYFGSLRKWCGVWTGGYAWTEKEHFLRAEDGDDHGYSMLRKKAMQMKEQFLYSLSEGLDDGNKDYLPVFEQAERLLNQCGALAGANRDINLMRSIDESFIRETRRLNAKVLMDALKDWLIFPDLKDDDCPLFVPILIPDGKREALRIYLINHEIYCPVHWPVSNLHRLGKKEAFLYQNELSLVCDQRYTEKDMKRVVETIYRFWKGV